MTKSNHCDKFEWRVHNYDRFKEILYYLVETNGSMLEVLEEINQSLSEINMKTRSEVKNESNKR